MKNFLAGLFLGTAVGVGGTAAYLFKSKRVRTLAKREIDYKVRELADRILFGIDEEPQVVTDPEGYVPPRKRPFRYGPPPRTPYERYRP